MHEVEVETVSSKAAQAVFTCSERPGFCRVFGKDFIDNEQLFAASDNGFANKGFGFAAGVHLRGVDQRHAKVKPEAKRGHLLSSTPRVFPHAPGALAKYWYPLAGGQPRSANGLRPISGTGGHRVHRL
jgi:hypothetical protein